MLQALLAQSRATDLVHLPGGLTLTSGTADFLYHAVTLLASLLIGLFLLNQVGRLERFTLRFAGRFHSADPTASQADRQQRIETISRVVLSLARALIWSTTILAVLTSLGIAVGPLLAGAGIAGVAVGFGAQSIVKDFFAGFFILLEGQFDVGDTVTIGTVTGVVEQMTLRLTMLRDPQGTAHFIPNSNINNVANKTHGRGRAVLDLTFAPKVAEDAGRALLLEVCERVQARLREAELQFEAPLLEGPNELSTRGLEFRVVIRCLADHGVEARRALLSVAAAVLREKGCTSADGAWTIPGPTAV